MGIIGDKLIKIKALTTIGKGLRLGSIGQKIGNYDHSSQKNRWPARVGLSKVLLEHNHASSFTIVYGHFRVTMRKLSSFNRDHMAHRA